MSSEIAIRVAVYVATGLMLLQPGYGQGRQPSSPPSSGGGTSPGSGGGTPRPTSPTPTPQPNTNNNQTLPAEQPQIIFLTGRVMLEDGTPPPQSVVIQRVCNGVTHAEGYTDARGYFSIQLGGGSQVFQDASMGGGFDQTMAGTLPGQQRQPSPFGMSNQGLTQSALMNCDINAVLPGYHSQSVTLANRRALDNPDIGVILLHRMGGDEGSTISAASLAAPKNAQKAFKKGEEDIRKKKLQDAQKEFEKAVQLYPGYAQAWCELGRIQMANKQWTEARTSFETAMKADPKYVNPYVQLSYVELHEQKWQQLADVTGHALKLNAFDYPQMFLFNSVANYNLKNLDAAEKSARQGERLDTRHEYPKMSQLLGVILAQRHDYTGAAEQLRTYLKFAPAAEDAATVHTQLEQLEKASAPSSTATAPQQ
ncbi:MAG TPA: tetratricopeptide repeat protein [Bryobacteraceae bacterium]|nr:tetratricopeptide repeat protein [Bryobacteraceae bacterium]